MRLCQYKDAFGKLNTGIHSYRFFGIAIFDTLLTVFIAFIISRFFGWNFLYTVIVFFLLGIFVHYIFCVESTVNKFVEKIIRSIFYNK